MLAVRKIEPSLGLSVCETSAPDAPGRGEVLIEVAAAGICGTDVHIYEWTPGYELMTSAMPVTVGHEFAGTVQAVGPEVRDIAVGARVVVRPSVVCGHCRACREENADLCENRRGIGVTRNGGFAPLVSVPAANCEPIPDDLAFEVAALTEPMTVSAEAVDTAGVRPGDRVLVLGPGTIGQGAALFAQAAGAADIVIVGKHDRPRLSALQDMGFTRLVELGERTLEQGLESHLRDGKFDVVIEATGVPAIIQQGLHVLRKRGVLTVGGIHPGPASIDLTRLVREHQQIRGSYRSPVATWQRVVAYLLEHADRVRPMISHRLPLQDALAGFELARRKAASKVIILPQA
jgi:threonine dehydrogenase-like Zn-dependent dehydrogenase